MKFLYRVDFNGRLNRSLGHTTQLRKTFVFDKPMEYEAIRLKLYETHEHVKILRITDLGKAAAFNEVKP